MISRRSFIAATGAILVAPLAAEAQQAGKLSRVISLRFSQGSGEYLFDAFRDQLRQLGYTEGQNIVLEVRQDQVIE